MGRPSEGQPYYYIQSELFSKASCEETEGIGGSGRELARVYLSNVEQICKRFVEEKRGSLGKLTEDKTKWSRYDGGSGDDFSKESIERDERRLTEVGRRTIELFVISHIFSSKIKVEYQEAVALKRQDELIREEEAEWMTGFEQKAKWGFI
ncbi:hypothetical protein Tco_0562109 [Tanacetum coccineum]